MTRTLSSYERNDTNLTLLFPSPPLSSSEEEGDIIATNEELLLITRFIVQKLCVPLVVLVGVIGNFLSVVVLTRKCMNSSTNSYLSALAVFDLLYLLFSFYLSLKHYQVFKYSPEYIYCFPFARVFTDMFANVSVVLTVTFTLERYVGVCHPMKGRILCTVERAKIITIVAAAFAILCTSPEFWEMEVTWEIKDNQSVPVATYTDFANQAGYAVGYYWFLVVIFTLLPLTLLCVFNGILIVTVVRAAEMRKQLTLLTPVSSDAPSNARTVPCQPREQQKITKILITIVIVFIVCQIPGALLLLYKTYTSLRNLHMTREQQNNLKIAGNVINLLIQINASINFILYSAISTKFRRVFYHIICNRKRWCYKRCQLWHHSTLSRSDGVKMSSFYGKTLLGLHHAHGARLHHAHGARLHHAHGARLHHRARLHHAHGARLHHAHGARLHHAHGARLHHAHGARLHHAHGQSREMCLLHC
ncbi:unnamed protein product [Candidula unifasciata]|uniref:G-protein coupled receptors family 1 profile domain-containing protein n=1 Tax=Candidula unifasciata TaxID=100452 RepID=A0A8S3ZTP3_9EUPU|nr:unnamed protein product [Candidula unifasciata]